MKSNIKIFSVLLVTAIILIMGLINCNENNQITINQHSQPKQPPVINKQLHINTNIDKYDVEHVIIWDNYLTRKNIVEQLHDGDRITMLKQVGDYIQIKTEAGNIGWCNIGFTKE